MISASPDNQKYSRYLLVLKIKRHLSTAAAFGNSVFFLMENLVSSWQQMKLEIWCGWAHPYKTIAKFIVHSIYHKLSRDTMHFDECRLRQTCVASFKLTNSQ